jgi:hypothetical protein
MSRGSGIPGFGGKGLQENEKPLAGDAGMCHNFVAPVGAAADFFHGDAFSKGVITMIRLVLLRHGESTWNLENRFTGWTDVDLTEQGVREAHQAGRLLREGGYIFDLARTSVLKRAIRTLWITLDEMDLMWIPVYRSWRLNERHYGALQGLNKRETAEKYGMEQVHIWRRSYDTPPPGPPIRRPQAWGGAEKRIAENDAGAGSSLLARGDRPGPPGGQEGPDRGAREQHPRPGEIPGHGSRGGDHGAEHPDGDSARL